LKFAFVSNSITGNIEKNANNEKKQQQQKQQQKKEKQKNNNIFFNDYEDENQIPLTFSCEVFFLNSIQRTR
jgi:hypothetical protein